MNFQEASEIAKRTPGSILSRDESGGFYVRGPNGQSVGSAPVKQPSLEQELKEKASKIQRLEHELSKLRLEIDAQVESKLKQRLESIEAEWEHVQKIKSQLRHKRDQTETKLRKLILLEHAYAERFGAAEVKEFTVTLKSRDVCSRCGGDGGVNGGCSACDGTGWVESQHETVQEEVEFK